MSNHRLKINKVVNKIRKAFFQCAVEFRRNMNSRCFLQTGETALITASDRSEDFNSQRKSCILDRVDKRPGENEMTSKTHRLIKANICRTGAVMAQDDVTKLTCQTAPDGIERKILIISNNIFHLFKVDEKGDSVLVLTKHGNKFVPFYSGIVGKIRERHCQNTGS
ncbi:hypothetical protein SAMN06297397_0553 [Aristaeella lactis]|uniref:Uncharacterized protein n=1 Tax=Aristaeella lactis TaxID=3046383 RepID=A0AC61PIP8_9FIRM|nr:hypothetical protein SAMN06297397_0553 [Aristaeella lactis]